MVPGAAFQAELLDARRLAERMGASEKHSPDTAETGMTHCG